MREEGPQIGPDGNSSSVQRNFQVSRRCHASVLREEATNGPTSYDAYELHPKLAWYENE